MSDWLPTKVHPSPVRQCRTFLVGRHPSFPVHNITNQPTGLDWHGVNTTNTRLRHTNGGRSAQFRNFSDRYSDLGLQPASATESSPQTVSIIPAAQSSDSIRVWITALILALSTHCVAVGVVAVLLLDLLVALYGALGGQ